MNSPDLSNKHDLSLTFPSIHVVILINYMRRHHVLAFKELAKRVGKLTILVSTPMEGNRDWEPQWDGLNVIIQSNSTITLNRSSGFTEKNYIHFPWDTFFQLRKLKPDVVFSYEMGMRTLLSSGFRCFNRLVPLVMVGNMSDSIEVRRGRARRGLRKIIRNTVDYCTYNGPSCKRYLEKLGVPANKLCYIPYCYDQEKTYLEPKSFSRPGVSRLLFCGLLNERKGILPFTRRLGEYCERMLPREIEFDIAGDGPFRDQLASMDYRNLNIHLHGSCSAEKLRMLYGQADVCVFPSLGDEWGLVPVEAWASGLPVLGSQYAQSVETICVPDENGWVFDSQLPESIDRGLSAMFKVSADRLDYMSRQSRLSVCDFVPRVSANKMCEVIERALSSHRGPGTPTSQQHQLGNARLKNDSDRPIPRSQFIPPSTDSRTSVLPRPGNQPESPKPSKPLATISLDLDNKWSYLKAHNEPSWSSLPSYLPQIVPRILSVLDEFNLKITFFVVGQDAHGKENANALAMIADDGHEIANHSFHHEPCLHLYSPDQLDREFELSEAAIKNATGKQTVGFRGPGFSLSDQTLKVLVRRGYHYDCSTFPTYLAPIARTYYFMTGSFSRQQKQDRKALFGRFSDGFLSNDPYLWSSDNGQLLELPVTTFPVIRTPVHATYLHYLASFSSFTSSAYFSSALTAYRLCGTSPSFLLHPLDFMGLEDSPDLAFFPGMKTNRDTKLEQIRRFLDMFCKKFDVLPMQAFAPLALRQQLDHRPVAFARTGIT